MLLDALVFLQDVVLSEGSQIFWPHEVRDSLTWVHILVDLHQDLFGVSDVRALVRLYACVFLDQVQLRAWPPLNKGKVVISILET